MGQTQLFGQQVQGLGGLGELGIGLRQMHVHAAQSLHMPLAGAETCARVSLPTHSQQQTLA